MKYIKFRGTKDDDIQIVQHFNRIILFLYSRL